jgi:hypothetical protein
VEEANSAAEESRITRAPAKKQLKSARGGVAAAAGGGLKKIMIRKASASDATEPTRRDGGAGVSLEAAAAGAMAAIGEGAGAEPAELPKRRLSSAAHSAKGNSTFAAINSLTMGRGKK